jgi:hypothetical protein
VFKERGLKMSGSENTKEELVEDLAKAQKRISSALPSWLQDLLVFWFRGSAISIGASS